jgi:hypothetical protein
MKKGFLLTMSLIAIGLMISCSGKNETIVYESEGYTITFKAPNGFFTQATNSEEYIRGFSFRVKAYISEKFKMQISLPGCSYTLSDWESSKRSGMKKTLFQEIEMEGTLGGAFRYYLHPRVRYSMLLEVGVQCLDIDFSPNDVKNLKWEEYANIENEVIQKCTELSTDKELLAIMKSLKIKKN